MSEQKEVKVYRAELYDEDYGAYTYHRVKVVLKSDYDALALENRKLKAANSLIAEQRNEAYRQHIETKYVGASAIEIYEQTKYQAQLQIEAEMEKCK